MAYGLRPAYHLTGGVIRIRAYPIASGYSDDLLVGDPLQILTDGTVALAAPSSSTQNIGVFSGVQYKAPDGSIVYSKVWPDDQVATEIKALVYDDPNIVYTVEADQDGAALTQAAVGANIDLTAAAGNIPNGLSGWYLDSSGSPGPTAAQVRILGSAEPDGNWTGVGVPMDVYVKFNEHAWLTTTGI